jgi:glycosyltransferase involved in cell wall biosynthesis
MISIIICSRRKTINRELSENIKNTIGYAYELIVIDNSENQYSIFEAYNLGIEKSTGNYLCFIHDDILFHTKDWGGVINAIFEKNEQIGLLGIAGAKIKTKMPSAWWDCPEEMRVINIIQHFNNREKGRWNYGFEKECNTIVVAIDGVFMTMRKDDRIRFDSKMKGFHNYDLNISFEYRKHGYIILVTNEILIEHFSIGTITEAWVASTYKIHNLYNDLLPLGTTKNEINKKFEITNAIRFCSKCLDYKRNMMAISIWKSLFFMNPISKYHYTFWKRIIKNSLC